jgi:glutaredoxin
VQRHPVTLYTGESCAPCDEGRRLLQQRGVPYTERRIVSGDDAAALERLIGARTLPGLSIGRQPLRGYSEQDWTATSTPPATRARTACPATGSSLPPGRWWSATRPPPPPKPHHRLRPQAPAPAPAEGIRF